MKPSTRSLLLITSSFLLPFIAMADPGDPPPDTLDTPIDTWVIVLIVAAVLFAARKAWLIRKRAKLQFATEKS